MYINPDFFGVRFIRDYHFKIPAKAIDKEDMPFVSKELCYEFFNYQSIKTGTLKIIPFRGHFHLELFIMAGFERFGLAMFEKTLQICKEFKLRMTRFDFPFKKFEDFSKRNIISTTIFQKISNHTEQAVNRDQILIQLTNI
jgi:hypothetical protein